LVRILRVGLGLKEQDMANTATPAGGDRSNSAPAKTIPWRLIFRIVRWTSYAGALITLILVLHTAPPPVIQTSPQAAARVEQKFDEVAQAVSKGEPATMRMDQTELNSYLATHLDIASNTAGTTAAAPPAPSQAAPANSAGGADGAVAALPAPTGTSAEQIEQVRSSVKDVKVELIEDRVRAYVVFDLHGKDMTLQLEGKLGSQDGYLRFEPISGQIGALQLPQSALQSAINHLMDSPENREKLKLPAEMSGLKIENGEVVATYK
jgi:hypothetical protein